MSLAVLVPAASVELASLADVQAELGLTAEPAQDARLGRLLRVASALVSTHCNRTFGLATYEQSELGYANRHGGVSILEARPVVALLGVSEAGVSLDAAQFRVDRDTGILRRAEWLSQRGELPGEWDGWRDRWWSHGGATVTFQAGYVLPGNDAVAGVDALPDDIVQATIETAKGLWYSSGTGSRDPRVRSEMVQGVGSVSYLDPTPQGGALPALAAEMVSGYRDRWF